MFFTSSLHLPALFSHIYVRSCFAEASVICDSGLSCFLWIQLKIFRCNPLQYSCLENPRHGRRSLIGCSPWGRGESDTTERLHFHFSLSCIGEGNGNPLQCSCLENPTNRGAKWAPIYGVAQSQIRLKWLSSSSSSSSGSDSKEFACYAGDRVLIPRLGRYPG